MRGEPRAHYPIGDKPARQRTIAKSLWFTLPGTYAVIALAYAALPPLPGVGEATARLVLALRWLPVALLPYAAVCLVILMQRFFEGAHNPLRGEESEGLAIHCRVMHNTLEQLVWFVLCLLALATWLDAGQARLIPIVCVAFAVARLVYWWGYLRQGTLGRAPGVQMTFAINVGMLGAVVVRLVGGAAV